MDALTFQAEVRAMERLMYHVSMSYLANVDDAADAVQDALARAWEKRHTLQETEHFRPWLMRILVNQCKDALRRRKRRRTVPLEENTAAAEMPLPRLSVMEAIGTLKPEQRTVVMLHCVEGLTIAETALILGLPLGTVKTRFRSARRQLTQTLLVEWEETV